MMRRATMNEKATKRAYATPSLVEYGSIAKLTQVGPSGDGGGGGGGPIIDIMVMLPLTP